MKLVVLQFDVNHLTSLLAQNLCQSSYLQNFIANSNHLIGHIPKTVRNCMSLFRVHLKRNQLREIYLKILVSIKTCGTLI